MWIKWKPKSNKYFSDIPKKENFGERPVYEIADNKAPIVAIVTDPEATQTQNKWNTKRISCPRVSLAMPGYVMNLANSLISSVLSERFEEITMQADAPFAAAMAGYSELVKSKDAFQMVVVPKEGKELEGLNALLLEAEKMKRFGFTNAELEKSENQYVEKF